MPGLPKRSLVLISGFGGGSYPLSDFAQNDADREDLEKIFGTQIVSPDVGDRVDQGALDRCKIILDGIHQLDPDTRITIVTYSGGGFVVRCLMSILRRDHPKLHERVDLITIEDGAIRGAYVPPSYLISQVLGSKGNRCKRNIPLSGLRGNLQKKLARELVTSWPLDVDAHRDRDAWIGRAEIGNHPDRTILLSKLDDLDRGRHWGEGAYTVGYSNGGTRDFDHSATQGDLFRFEGRFLCLPNFRLRIVYNLDGFEIDTSDLACLKGSNIQLLKLEFTEKTGSWARAPGCFSNSTGSAQAEAVKQEFLRGAEDYKTFLKTDVLRTSQEEVAYIHTTSSLDISDNPWFALFGEFEKHTKLNKIRYREENQRHWDAWYRAENIELVKDGPP